MTFLCNTLNCLFLNFKHINNLLTSFVFLTQKISLHVKTHFLRYSSHTFQYTIFFYFCCKLWFIQLNYWLNHYRTTFTWKFENNKNKDSTWTISFISLNNTLNLSVAANVTVKLNIWKELNQGFYFNNFVYSLNNTFNLCSSKCNLDIVYIVVSCPGSFFALSQTYYQCTQSGSQMILIDVDYLIHFSAAGSFGRVQRVWSISCSVLYVSCTW